MEIESWGQQGSGSEGDSELERIASERQREMGRWEV